MRFLGFLGAESVDVVEDCVIRWRSVEGRGASPLPTDT
jgi:hypothetical protein